MSGSPRTVRIVGALLAAIWLCAGVAGIAVGAGAQRWLLVAAGLFAVWYGIVWLAVARLGRRVSLRQALKPWRAVRGSRVDT
jgi:hypothetical protein